MAGEKGIFLIFCWTKRRNSFAPTASAMKSKQFARASYSKTAYSFSSVEIASTISVLESAVQKAIALSASSQLSVAKWQIRRITFASKTFRSFFESLLLYLVRIALYKIQIWLRCRPCSSALSNSTKKFPEIRSIGRIQGIVFPLSISCADIEWNFSLSNVSEDRFCSQSVSDVNRYVEIGCSG